MLHSTTSILSLVVLSTVLIVSQAHIRRGLDDRHLAEEKDALHLDGPIQIGDYIWPSTHAFHEDPSARCGTEETTDAAKAEMIKIESDFYRQNEHRLLSEEAIVVDTYFHIIKSSSGNGATMKMVEDQVDVLNHAYGPHFIFNLTGVTVTVNDEWYNLRRLSVADLTMRATLRQGGANAINIYVANSRGLGWAQPLMSYKLSPATDGVIILDQSMPGGMAAPYNLGMTAVHEIGHSLGLLHTFTGGCDAAGTNGDFINDTPRQAGPTIGCPIGLDSCKGGGMDPIHNYMDYSDDECMTEFTDRQFKRMRAMWFTFRANRDSEEGQIDDSIAISCTKIGLDQAVCKNDEQCCGGVCQPCSK